MTQLKALLFDVDGTLAETERDGHRVAFNRAFKEQGLPWRWDERRYGELLAVAGGSERITAYARSDHPQWLAQNDAPERIGQIHRDKNRHYAALVAAGDIRLRSGVTALLEEAVSNKLRLAIVTTTYRSNVDALLAAALDDELRNAFEVFVTGEDVAHKKPDPECYNRALDALNLPPDATLAIEDSPNGLNAARNAGIHSLVVPSDYFRDEDFAGADIVAREFTDVTLSSLRHRLQ